MGNEDRKTGSGGLFQSGVESMQNFSNTWTSDVSDDSHLTRTGYPSCHPNAIIILENLRVLCPTQ